MPQSSVDKLINWLLSIGIDPIYFFGVIFPVLFWFISGRNIRNWKNLNGDLQLHYGFSFIIIGIIWLLCILRFIGLFKY